MLVLGLVDIPWWGIMLLTFAVYTLYSMRYFYIFKRVGIPGPMPLPFFGTVYIFFSGKSPPKHERDMLERYGNNMSGEFLGPIPALNVYNEDMISDIMVKEFSSFSNRLRFRCNEPINDSMLVNLVDAHWKHVRNEMTPTFTSGRLRRMNTEINRCASILADSLAEQAKTSAIVEIKDFSGGYTMDVIASTAFGIRVNSQTEKDNDFVTYAKKALNSKRLIFNVMLTLFFPEIAKLIIMLGFKMYSAKDVQDFFTGVVKQAMERRKSESDNQAASHSDFLQLMINAQKGENIKDDDDDDEDDKQGDAEYKPSGITTDEILANALLFFLAGYDTTSTSLSFFMHNMACYPDVQDKLIAEINSVIGDKEFVDLALVQKMPYLDQCINENLRLYPPAPRVNREASRDVTIRGVFIQKGTLVTIPIYGIHMDPTKWPEPDNFDPERFSPENKKNRSPYHFLPFGYGPRNCIAMRLALQEIKVAAISVLRKVKISQCEKTHNPMVFETGNGQIKAKNVYVKVEPRS